MDDLETYQVQLAQVELALAADPSSTELSSLRSELKELIELSQVAIAQAEAAASSSKSDNRKSNNSTPGHAWSAGDECLAKYSGDGSWYPARITSIGGAAENRVYSIVFKGYNTTELVKSSDIKPLPPNYSNIPSSNKRKLSKVEEDEREKKKKNEKKLEVKAAKAKEQTQKQATWQKFAKKSEKKGVHIAGVSGTSIFKTPDNPLGRGNWSLPFVYLFRLTNSTFFQVGVTGSGKGMTEVALKSKHKFEIKDDDGQ